MRLFKSFGCAIRGIIYTICNERNMRIHTVCAVFVFYFSQFFEMSAVKYAVLAIVVALVMASEIFNTSIEMLADMYASNYDFMAKISKDIAAGAVLIVSILAVIVGVILFWQPEGFYNIYKFFSDSVWKIVILVLVVALSIVYIIFGPSGIKGFFIKEKIKK